jgi:hypothetical protein
MLKLEAMQNDESKMGGKISHLPYLLKPTVLGVFSANAQLLPFVDANILHGWWGNISTLVVVWGMIMAHGLEHSFPKAHAG